MTCTWCGESMLIGEQHTAFQEPMHVECGIRAVCGSVAHIEGRCSCYRGGSAEGDDPALTRRQNASAAAAAFWRTREIPWRRCE